MTTIAYKDGVIVCNSGSTGGLVHGKESQKITSNGKGITVAHSGDLVYNNMSGVILKEIEDLIIRDDEMEKTLLNLSAINSGDHSVLIFIGDRIVYHLSKDKDYRFIEEYSQQDILAIGSGREYALGAMYAGASAEEAVQISIKHDRYTLGEVITHTLDSHHK